MPKPSFAFGTLPTDEFGLGVRDAAMGMAYTAVADDFTAVYYNPAGLTLTDPGLSLNFGYKTYGRFFSVPEEDAQDSAGIPVVGVTYRHEYSVGTGWWRLPALGFAALTPLPDIRRQKDDNDPHSIRYNSQGLLPIYIGTGYQITPRVRIGATLALTVAGSFRATAVATGTILTPELGGLAISGPVEIGAAPHVGILLGPFKDWHFGLSYRGAQGIELETSFAVEPMFSISLPPPLGTIAPGRFPIVTGWSPHQIAGGVAYRGLPGWLFSSDLVFKKWDDWKSSTGRHPDPEFHNRVVPRLGIEHQLTKYLALQGGYYFEPSPVPEQRGDTSYVDNDQHVFSMGLSYSLDKFLRLHTVITPGLQVHWLTDRTTRKAERSNDFFPGYDIGGSVISGGVVIRIHP